VTQLPLLHSQLLQLRRWNTPTVYNGWEQITSMDAAAPVTNLEPTLDFMPQMGAMVGWAVTLVVEPSQGGHKNIKSAWSDYREYIASQPGPKIVVVQDLDKPRVIGSFWGEVTSNTHRALDCVGTIVDGAIRDVDEMCYAGFKALARRLCVGHAHSTPVRWGCDVEVFGTKVAPGQLIHADKHGFIAIPFGDEARLLEASLLMDANECETVISAARSRAGVDNEALLAEVNRASVEFRSRAKQQFGRQGEH
jgi:4-hydroxy-4-methyl-2-oxoglutarate aldolase